MGQKVEFGQISSINQGSLSSWCSSPFLWDCHQNTSWERKCESVKVWKFESVKVWKCESVKVKVWKCERESKSVKVNLRFAPIWPGEEEMVIWGKQYLKAIWYAHLGVWDSPEFTKSHQQILYSPRKVMDRAHKNIFRNIYQFCMVWQLLAFQQHFQNNCEPSQFESQGRQCIKVLICVYTEGWTMPNPWIKIGVILVWDFELKILRVENLK